MITQKYKQGDNEIKIESAESIEDAKKNGFSAGENVRYFVNEKLTNYYTMVQFMVSETRKNKKKFIPEEKNLMKLRDQMLETQKEEMRQGFEDLKKTYEGLNVPEHILKDIDNSISKINQIGVRVTE